MQLCLVGPPSSRTAGAAAVLLAILAGCGPAARRASTTPMAADATLLRTLPAAEQATAGVLVLAADARYLCWTSTVGITCARHGGDAVVRVPEVYVTWMAVLGDDLVYRAIDGSGAAVWSVPLAGGAPRRLSGAAEVGAIDSDDGEVTWSEGRALRRLSRGAARVFDAAGESVVRREGPGIDAATTATCLAVDGERAYWATRDPGPRDDQATWTIVGAPRGGGPIAVVARDQPPVIDLAARAGQVCWSTIGAGLRCAGPAGVREVLAEADGQLGSGAALVYVPVEGSALVMLADGRPRLVQPPAREERWAPLPPVVLPDAIIAGTITSEGLVHVWRLPHPTVDAPTVLRASASEIRTLTTSAGHLYAVEVVDDDDPTAVPVDRLVAIADDGSARPIAVAAGFEAIAADRAAIGYAVPPADGDDHGSIWIADDGAPPRRVVDRVGGELLGLSLAGRALFWIEDGAIWTAPRSGGRPSRFHQPTWGDAGGNGRVQLIVDGASVYFSSVGLGATGIYRTRGGADATELMARPDDGLGDDLVRVGGDLFVVSGLRTVWRAPMAGGSAAAIYTAPEGDTVAAITGGGDRLYVQVRTEAGDEVLAIDPADPERAPTVAHRAGDRLTAMVADDAALYLATEGSRWLVRVPRAAARAAARATDRATDR